MYQLVAFVYRTGTGPARTMKLSVLASGASEHRLAFADMDQQRRKDGLHRRAVWISNGGRTEFTGVQRGTLPR
jgi:hypothetical protein